MDSTRERYPQKSYRLRSKSGVPLLRPLEVDRFFNGWRLAVYGFGVGPVESLMRTLSEAGGGLRTLSDGDQGGGDAHAYE